jgi:exosortase
MFGSGKTFAEEAISAALAINAGNGVMERIRLDSSLKSAVPFLISFGALVLLVAPTLESVFSRWLKLDESYSHGSLLLVVAAFLTFRKWKSEPPVPGFYAWWLVPFVLALAGYVLGAVLRVEALQNLVLVPLFLSLLAMLVGWDQGKKFILPVGVLAFTMPFWDYLSWPLQLITVAVNEFGLGLLGIDFRIDGVYVFLTGVGTFEVAQGCSGLRYLLVGQALAMLYGELNLRAIRSRVILFLAAIGLALFANWVRVFIIIYMGYETNMQTSLIEDHDNFGWWVFAATLIPLFILGRRLERTAVEEKIDNAGAQRQVSGVLAKSRNKYFAPILVSALAGLMLLVVPSNRDDIRDISESYEFRLDGEEYGQLFASRLEGWRPQIRNADRLFQQTLFERAPEGETPKQLYVSVHSYDYQRQGAEVVQYFNRIYASDEWRLENVFDLAGPGGETFSGVTIQHRVSGEEIHLAYSYYVEGIWESDQVRAKLAQLAGLFNNRTDASQITFGVSCEDCDGAEALGQVIRLTLPDIVQEIDEHYRG